MLVGIFSKSRFRTSPKVAGSRQARRPSQRKKAPRSKEIIPGKCPWTKTTAPKTVLAAAPRKARTAQDRNKSRPSTRSTLRIGFTRHFPYGPTCDHQVQDFRHHRGTHRRCQGRFCCQPYGAIHRTIPETSSQWGVIQSAPPQGCELNGYWAYAIIWAVK